MVVLRAYKQGLLTVALCIMLGMGCGDDEVGTTSIEADTSTFGDSGANTSSNGAERESCGHRVEPAIVSFGFNLVVDSAGSPQVPQGRPIQEGWGLVASSDEILEHNHREYARIVSYMMPIRDALMCDIATLDEAEWISMTQILTLNGIKTEQDLSGTPPEQVYSTQGIFDLLTRGENYHPMMKYLEEAELELKCIAFQDFDFTNPEGDDHCAIHALPVGQGLLLP